MENHISENDQTPGQHPVAGQGQPADRSPERVEPEQADPEQADPAQAVAAQADPEHAVAEQVDPEEAVAEPDVPGPRPDEHPGYESPVSVDTERTDYKAFYPHGLRLN